MAADLKKVPFDNGLCQQGSDDRMGDPVGRSDISGNNYLADDAGSGCDYPGSPGGGDRS